MSLSQFEPSTPSPAAYSRLTSAQPIPLLASIGGIPCEAICSSQEHPEMPGIPKGCYQGSSERVSKLGAQTTAQLKNTTFGHI